MSDKWGDQSTFTLLDYYRECGALPAGWSIELVAYNDEASLTLCSPLSDIDVCTDDMTTGEIIREMVRVARAIHNGDDPDDEREPEAGDVQPPPIVYRSARSGRWSDPDTWTPRGIPRPWFDGVTIASGHCIDMEKSDFTHETREAPPCSS